MAGRIDALRAMLERNPGDGRLLFGLALEHEKAGDWDSVCDALQRYLDVAEDEGNAWGRLGNAFHRLGRDDDARNAYARGIDVALAHGHPSMAAEFEEILENELS